MNQINKIKKSMEIIKQLLPKTYEIPEITVYSTVYNMIRATTNYTGETYKSQVRWYNEYFKNHKKSKEDYIKTKYYKPIKNRKWNQECFKLSALGGNPISINLQNTEKYTLDNYLFLLLHEVGHRYYKPKGKEYNERLCDLFAIRWFKKYLNKGVK